MYLIYVKGLLTFSSIETQIKIILFQQFAVN
jgi:hypothetical protein